MPIVIPDSHKDLLEQPIVVILGSVSAEGKPSSAAVWRRWDGEFIHITSDPNTRKHRNIKANPNVSVMTLDPKNPYRYIEIAGVVEELTHDGALEELNRHTMMYLGKPDYFGDVEAAEKLADYNGIVFKIRPTRVATYG